MRIVNGRPDGSTSAAWTEHLTGAAWMDLLLQEASEGAERTPDADGTVTLTSVTFTPGSRSHWHRHSAGQLLIVVSGEGWVGDREEGRRVVRVGDMVWTGPGEDHWHGATNGSVLTHLAVTLGVTHWYDEPVDTTSAEG
jgi:quercetin dioxygenase-like cupin family protein